MPCGGIDVGGRRDSRPPPVNATAIGNDDSLVTSMIVSPPASATEYTRCTASPLGIRTLVSTTGVPSSTRLTSRRLVLRPVPAVVGGDEPVERRRAVPRLDRAPRA